MNLQFWRKPEKKDAINLADHEPWRTWATYGASGEYVDTQTAMELSTVAACVRVISQDVGKLPLGVYRETSQTASERATDHPLWTILGRQPNSFQTAQEFKEVLTLHAALTGDGFAMPVRSGNGRIVEIIPLLPEWVEICRHEDIRYGLYYRVRNHRGKLLGEFMPGDIFHLRNSSYDTLCGLDAVKKFRKAIGLSKALETSQSSLHKNGGRPSGILSTPNKLNKEAAENLREAWQHAHGGADSMGKVAILDSGFTFTPITQSSADSQTLESRRLQIEEICRAFGVFPQMVGHAENTPYNSAEAFFSAHFRQTIWPWLVRWEQCLDRDLLDKRGPLYAKFDTRGFEKASTKDRSDFYRTVVETGIYTRNEIRELEGLPPIAGLDEPLTPLNMDNANGTQDAPADG